MFQNIPDLPSLLEPEQLRQLWVAELFFSSKLCRLSHFWGTFWDILMLYLEHARQARFFSKNIPTYQLSAMKITSPKHTWFVCILPNSTISNTTLDIISSSIHPLPHSFVWRCKIGIFRVLRSPEYATLFWLLGSWNVFLVGQIRKFWFDS